jgi:DNA-binding LytR/AlgR family response regulator
MIKTLLVKTNNRHLQPTNGSQQPTTDNKMKCIAIDDEPKALAIIRHYADKVPALDLVREFRSSLDALSYLNHETVDLIFLDINMPDLTGIEFLQALPQPPMIIFTTAYSEYAVQSYDWDAVGYLLKPIEFTRFLKAVNKATAQLGHHRRTPSTDGVLKNNGFLLVKSGVQTFQLKLAEILYIESSGNHVIFVTRQRKVMTLTTLQEVLRLLPPTLFYRVHKSFIIALQHLEVIESFQVKVNGLDIPLGKTYREAFLEEYKK